MRDKKKRKKERRGLRKRGGGGENTPILPPLVPRLLTVEIKLRFKFALHNVEAAFLVMHLTYCYKLKFCGDFVSSHSTLSFFTKQSYN